MAGQLTKQQLKEKYQEEQVFVVPFAVLSGIEDKFTRQKHTQDIWSRFDTVGKYIYRYDAEGEPAFQQIIPYILVKHPTENKYYVSKRLKGESRLIDRISLGFGGHINLEDGYKDVVFRALFRELNEELLIQPLSSAEFVGYVRDMNSLTNDHTGCVFVVQANNVEIKETDNLEGSWMSVEELIENYYSFEEWAKHIIDYLHSNNKKF